MRKLLLAFIAVLFLSATFASELPKNPPLNANSVFIPVGKTGQKISLMELSSIKVKELEAMTGQKMKFADRIGFKLAQNKLRKAINADGSFRQKKMEKALTKRFGGESGFHFGGFALGFFLGLIGVLIAYLINDDYKQNRVKWAWLGLAIILAINLLIILAFA